MHILFFQYGDYGEDYRRLIQGGEEYFRDQRYSVDFTASFRANHNVSIVAIGERPHKEQLAQNLFSIGIDSVQAYTPAAINRLLNELAPDVIVLRTPHNGVLQWARKRRVPTLPLFADFISRPRGPKQLFQAIRLRQALMDDIFPAVANHSRNASLSLVQNLRLRPSRVVPWDRPLLTVNPVSKTMDSDPQQVRAFFAGTLSQDKGVGDCLDAIHLLKARNFQLSFRFAGAGDSDAWMVRAQALGIADQVAFLGVTPNPVVVQEMRASDLVVVPSRHSYAEGLPNTLSEGLASRTPVIVSDHPAFASRLRHGSDAFVFQGASAPALADAIQSVVQDPALYAKLSVNSEKACHRLFFGIEWAPLISLFLSDPTNRTGWVAEHSLEKYLRERAVTDSRN